MSGSHPGGPIRPSRPRAPKKFFKDLIMPAVPHPAGAVPEGLQPKSDSRSVRFAVICWVTAILVFGSWIAFSQIRKAMKRRSLQATGCCGCEQGRSGQSCAGGVACPLAAVSRSACRSDRASSPGSGSSSSRTQGTPSSVTGP